MCSCGNETGCIGIDNGCLCVCHHSEFANRWAKTETEKRALVLQNERLQNALEEIVAAHTRPEPMWDSPAALGLQMKKIARAALTATEKPFCACRPMTYQENAATGHCVKCGKPIEKRNDEPPKERLIPCRRCGFFHGPDCANPPRE